MRIDGGRLMRYIIELYILYDGPEGTVNNEIRKLQWAGHMKRMDNRRMSRYLMDKMEENRMLRNPEADMRNWWTTRVNAVRFPKLEDTIARPRRM